MGENQVCLLDDLTAAAIGVPVAGGVPPDCPAQDAADHIWETAGEAGVAGPYVLGGVEQDGVTLGLFDIPDCNGDGTIGDIARAPDSEAIISSDASLYELVVAFASSPLDTFLLATGDRITHSVHYHILLYATPFRMALFSLLLDIEAGILERSLWEPEEAFECLSAGRREKAIETNAQTPRLSTPRGGEQGHLTAQELLPFTTYTDKCTVATKHEAIWGSLPFDSRNQARRFFCKTGLIRNMIAHGRSLVTEIDRGDLASLVQTARDVVLALAQPRVVAAGTSNGRAGS